jgi:hypothetical protein
VGLGRIPSLLLLFLLVVACDRPSVLVVGLDGADWEVMDPLMEAGFLPAMRDVVEGGARGEQDCRPALASLPCFCPPVWTSLFTGHVFPQHQVVFDDQPPEERGVKAVWSVLRDYAGSAASVSMHNQLPLDPGFTHILAKPGVDWAASKVLAPWPLRLPAGASDPALRTRPPDLFEALGMLPHAGERPPVWSMIARDRVAMEGLRRLLRHSVPDLTIIHLHSPDKVAHIMWGSVQTAPATPLLEDVLLREAEAWDAPHEAPRPWGWGPVVAPYLEIDRWLGELLEQVEIDYVVFLSDHGMERNSRPGGLPGHHGITAPEAHRGILAIRGPGVIAGADVGTVDVTDVAPTLAYLLDLPVGEDLPGRVIEQAFTLEQLALRPIRSVPSWEDAFSLLDWLLEIVALYGDEAVHGAGGAAGDDAESG